MGHIAGERDRDLHVDGGHRSMAPDGDVTGLFDLRLAAHRAAHAAEVHAAELWWYAGAPFKAGTNLPNNVTGECGHKHKSPDGARQCIARVDASMKRGFGPSAYCDRVVMVHDENGTRVWSEPET